MKRRGLEESKRKLVVVATRLGGIPSLMARWATLKFDGGEKTRTLRATKTTLRASGVGRDALRTGV